MHKANGFKRELGKSTNSASEGVITSILLGEPELENRLRRIANAKYTFRGVSFDWFAYRTTLQTKLHTLSCEPPKRNKVLTPTCKERRTCPLFEISTLNQVHEQRNLRNCDLNLLKLLPVGFSDIDYFQTLPVLNIDYFRPSRFALKGSLQTTMRRLRTQEFEHVSFLTVAVLYK